MAFAVWDTWKPSHRSLGSKTNSVNSHFPAAAPAPWFWKSSKVSKDRQCNRTTSSSTTIIIIIIISNRRSPTKWPNITSCWTAARRRPNSRQIIRPFLQLSHLQLPVWDPKECSSSLLQGPMLHQCNRVLLPSLSSPSSRKSPREQQPEIMGQGSVLAQALQNLLWPSFPTIVWILQVSHVLASAAKSYRRFTAPIQAALLDMIDANEKACTADDGRSFPTQLISCSLGYWVDFAVFLSMT